MERTQQECCPSHLCHQQQQLQNHTQCMELLSTRVLEAAGRVQEGPLPLVCYLQDLCKPLNTSEAVLLSLSGDHCRACLPPPPPANANQLL